jgi:hypothetical protein
MTKLQDSKTEWQKNFEKNATDQSLGTAVSRIAGFLRDATMTALFDRGITDAWVLAFRGPHFFSALPWRGGCFPGISKSMEACYGFRYFGVKNTVCLGKSFLDGFDSWLDGGFF